MIEGANLALATLAFVGSHFALSHPFRIRLVQNLGEAAFRAIYSVIALVTLGWMILAFLGTAPGTALWIAPDWWWPVAAALMLLASVLLVGSLFGNPALPQRRAKTLAVQPPRGVFAITRHPMNWSFALWAIVHLSLWGELRNIIVALGILILAIGGSIGQDRKKRAVMGASWLEWEARTGFVPLGALFSGKVAWRSAAPGWIAVCGGAALWLLATWLHAPAVSPIVFLFGG